MVRAYNEVLGGELQPEVELLLGVEARWAEEPGSEEEGELVEDGQGVLQPGGRASAVMWKRVEREEQGGGIKRRGHQSVAGQAGVKRRRQRQGKSAQGQADGKWYLKGFSTSPGGTKPVAGKYTVGALESQVWVQGEAGTEVWLGVKLARSKGGGIGWMHSGELQRRVGDDCGWREKPRGKGREGWMVQRHRWESNGKEAVVGRGNKGEVLGWYLPVRVVDEKALTRAGVKVVVQMRRVAVGRSAGAYTKAVGIRSRREWYRCRHTISRKELVGITGRLVHADGQEEVLVVGDEV